MSRHHSCFTVLKFHSRFAHSRNFRPKYKRLHRNRPIAEFTPPPPLKCLKYDMNTMRWANTTHSLPFKLCNQGVKSGSLSACDPQRIYTSDRRDSTAPAIVLQRFHSPNLSPLCLQIYCTSCPSERADGERLGESNFCKTMAAVVPSTIDIYSLLTPHILTFG